MHHNYPKNELKGWMHTWCMPLEITKTPLIIRIHMYCILIIRKNKIIYATERIEVKSYKWIFTSWNLYFTLLLRVIMKYIEKNFNISSSSWIPGPGINHKHKFVQLFHDFLKPEYFITELVAFSWICINSNLQYLFFCSTMT